MHHRRSFRTLKFGFVQASSPPPSFTKCVFTSTKDAIHLQINLFFVQGVCGCATVCGGMQQEKRVWVLCKNLNKEIRTNLDVAS